MVTKTFICDLCKKSVGESELYPITITITRPAKSYNKMLSVAKDKSYYGLFGSDWGCLNG